MVRGDGGRIRCISAGNVAAYRAARPGVRPPPGGGGAELPPPRRAERGTSSGSSERVPIPVRVLFVSSTGKSSCSPPCPPPSTAPPPSKSSHRILFLLNGSCLLGHCATQMRHFCWFLTMVRLQDSVMPWDYPPFPFAKGHSAFAFQLSMPR